MMAVPSGSIPFGLPSGPDPYGSPVDPLAGMSDPFGSGSLLPPLGSGPDPFGSPVDPFVPGPFGLLGPDPGSFPAISMPDPHSMSSPIDPLAVESPPGYSYVTGTIDPTPAEIVKAAADAGTPIPPGMDPVMFSKMMSGGALMPPIMPPSTPVTGLLGGGASLAPPLSVPSPVPAPIPAPIVEPTLAAPAPKMVMPEAGAPKIRMPKFGKMGAYSNCDPITGKCPRYA